MRKFIVGVLTRKQGLFINSFLKYLKILVLPPLAFIFVFCLIPISFANDSYVWTSLNSALETSADVSDSENTDLNLESESAILIEQNSGQVLYEMNAHEQLRPASVTKIMSILLIMEALDEGKISLDDKIPCSENAASMGGSQIWLDVREELSVNDMLKAICVASANDATVALAEYLAGSEEAFVKKMNEKAKELGMNDTTFKNCHGLDTDGHVTSSYDIALMSRDLLTKHPGITNYTTIYMDTLRDGKSELVNTNKLIRNYKGATGLKTGSTGLALYNLSASATRDGLSLIAVIMKAPSTKLRFAEAKKLLDYGFSNYSYTEFVKKDTVLKSINVNKGIEQNVDVVFAKDCGVVMKKGMEQNIEQIVSLKNSVDAPVYKGQKLGEVQYVLNGEVLSSVDIIAEKDVKKISFISLNEKIVNSWFNLLR